tara:strand:+ start:367 stop:705 length:339 start_codon:yes stop_codon:yes gene_type:complete
MAVTWDVFSLEATKTVGSLSDVVTTVHWTASDSETVGSGDSAVVHQGNKRGATTLADADSGSFIAYNSITKDDAIAWAKAAMGDDLVKEAEEDIAAQITESKTPTTTIGVPW